MPLSVGQQTVEDRKQLKLKAFINAFLLNMCFSHWLRADFCTFLQNRKPEHLIAFMFKSILSYLEFGFSGWLLKKKEKAKKEA